MTMTTHATNDLHRVTAHNLSENIFRAMHVAALDENGEPKKMTQHELADKAGVGRSTIAKYTAHNDGETAANPDLDTICRLADALNVPPAFLLMTRADWIRLAQAVLYFNSAVKDEKFVEMMKASVLDGTASIRSSASTGLNLARKFDVYSDQPPSPEMPAHYARAIKERNRRIRDGILAMSALPPSSGPDKGYLIPLLPLCAIMGARLQEHDEQE